MRFAFAEHFTDGSFWIYSWIRRTTQIKYFLDSAFTLQNHSNDGSCCHIGNDRRIKWFISNMCIPNIQKGFIQLGHLKSDQSKIGPFKSIYDLPNNMFGKSVRL